MMTGRAPLLVVLACCALAVALRGEGHAVAFAALALAVASILALSLHEAFLAADSEPLDEEDES